MAFPTPKAVAKHTSANLFRYPVTHLVTNPFLDFLYLVFLTWQPRKNTVGVKMTSRISFLSFLVVCRTIRRFIIPPTPTPRVFELFKIGSFSFRFRFSFYAICSRNVPCTLGLLHVKIKTHVFFSAVFTLQLYITHPGKAHTPHPREGFLVKPEGVGVGICMYRA